jgi:hypothetical protein
VYWLNRKKKKQKRARGEEDDIGDINFDDRDNGRVPLERKKESPLSEVECLGDMFSTASVVIQYSLDL